MVVVWEVENGTDWTPLGKGNASTTAFIESRFVEFEQGGAPRRTVRIGRRDQRLDFSRMAMAWGDGSRRLRRRWQEAAPSAPAATAPDAAPRPPGAPGDLLRGLSVHYLCTELARDLEREGLTPRSTIREIEPVLIRKRGAGVECPRDGRLGAAFVDVVAGEDHVGRATHMLSYTWSYQIGEVLTSLQAWCARKKLDPKDVRVWICCFCINQHRVIEAQEAGKTVPFEMFQHEFETRVRGIGRVLALMGSWQQMLYTTRVWCVFELYTALELQSQDPLEHELEILISPQEEELFRQTLIDGDGLDPIWKVLSGIRVQDADSFVKQDRERILALVRDGPGCAKLNKEIVGHLHAWFAASSEGHLSSRLRQGTHDLASARACARVGDMLERTSKYECAFQILRTGREILRATGDLDNENGIVLLRILGTVLRRLGDSEQALRQLQRAQEVHRRLDLASKSEYAALLQEIGRAHGDLSNLDAELMCHMEALRIREHEGTMATPEGAGLLRSLGMVHFQKYAYPEALEFFEKAKALHDKTASLMTPEGAAVLQSIGDVLSSTHPPRFADALSFLERAYSITEQLGIGESPKGVAQLRRLAFLHAKLSQPERAAQLSGLAREIGRRLHRAKEKKMASLDASPKAVVATPALPQPWEEGVGLVEGVGVYFELVNESSHVDPEGRGFPHSLCTFETKTAVGIAPEHLMIAWGEAGTMTTKGRIWTLNSEVFERSAELRDFGEGLGRRSPVKGHLSPLHAVNLADDAKERAGIPPSAKFFMFSYPATLGPEEGPLSVPTSSDPDLAFLSNGGYVYLDESTTRIVRINALLPSSGVGLCFGPPLKWEAHWSDRLFTAGRFRPITVDVLKRTGLTHFCWIRPNEVMWFGKAEGAPVCPYGGFAYVRYTAPAKRSLKRHRDSTPSTPEKRCAADVASGV